MPLEGGGVLERRRREVEVPGERADDGRLDVAAGELVEDVPEADRLLDQPDERRPLERRARGRGHHDVLRAGLEEVVLEGALVLEVRLGLAPGDLEERRLRDVEVPLLDDLRHLPVEERQEERADVRAVDVRVGHDDDRVVADLRDVEVAGADAGAERGDERLDLRAGQHLVEPRLLDVEDLAAERQDRLVLPVAALLRGAAGRVALHDVEFRQRRVALLAVGELSGQPRGVERPLAPRQLLGLARRLAGPGRLGRLVDDLARDRRVLLEVGGEAFVDELLDEPLDLGVAELRLRLPLELRVRQLDRDDGHEPLADVVALERRVLEVLEERVGRRVGVDGPRERRLEADQVRPAVDGVDVVREAEDRLVVAVVVLHRDLDDDPVLLRDDGDRLRVDRGLARREELDEGDDAPLVVEVVAPGRLAPLVADGDLQAAIEEGQFPQALREGLEGELGRLEDLRVRLEAGPRAGPLGDADLGERLARHAAIVRLIPDLAPAADLDLAPLRQRVHHRGPDAVEPARDLVGLVVELPARVQHGHDDLGRALPGSRVLVDRHAPAVVLHGDRVVGVDGDLHLGREAGEGFVDGVVDDLVDEMVQAGRPGRPDVHRRPLSHGGEAFEDLDAAGVVGRHDGLVGHERTCLLSMSGSGGGRPGLGVKNPSRGGRLSFSSAAGQACHL